MYYEINVVKDGVHFFATHERSITSSQQLRVVLKVFMDKFPTEEGYMLMISRHEDVGYMFTVDDITQGKDLKKFEADHNK